MSVMEGTQEGLSTPENTSEVSWEDLIRFSEQNLGLRHVVSIAEAEREIKTGVKGGDAVSLAAPQNLVPLSGDLERLRDYSFSKIAPLIPKEDRPEIISGFEKAIKSFLEESIGVDINSGYSENTKLEELLKMLIAQKSAFIVARFQGADRPYDHDAYHGLGKCGKQSVPPEKIVGMISFKDEGVEELADRVGLSPEELKSTVTKEVFDKIKQTCSTVLWEQFLTIVKEKP